ncbi:glucose-6-phosphate isomerase [Candidatus Arthromitus sp. SFB-mouse-Japan]|uniref:glucose-6-phosphate isomerase n=1 Tax=Candidatus Arthromitus sp. SFB-mouse TaxID=49118 RepID=UPI00021B7E6E|nr:glucose-6-phosphate isomerase [Candidatus Arthromitus sp. SFB-mouse]EIA21674.1 Glucose-6-phosphate isomerase [Candidatus Arthromitus sp. SFB-2]EIA24166.1 Glucose-6-phosphate isomerase [Candidatus Arthromitus sp. SFB-1]EIA26245.1 Glucose-6-phosphate isomerase [Candidatus Arthromitus sp. SFB-4]EIA28312.1 Glucose-6-phosphate isomerase [Candidatus Arthromitus sp. SFB-co]EIA29873.1 Glucose-6-phosphate isomerase [Candidatus Arthromitus sp. SFB-mouse-SU]
MSTCKLKFDDSKLGNYINSEELALITPQVKLAHELLKSNTGAGSDFLGWINLPNDYDREEYNRIKITAQKIRDNADVLIVIGIGGSYLGAKACIESLNSTFFNYLSPEDRKAPQIFFAGNSISSTYLIDLLELIKDKSVYVNVISKSGTTTEPALAFRFFKSFLEEKYGKDGARDRIIATTDKARGALKGLADSEGYETFVIPDDVGGRFSVLTPVGLLPIAVSGADIDALMQGARDAIKDFGSDNLDENACYRYAATRNILYRKGYSTEILASYEPSLTFFAEWWKQLYGESEGKDKKGIYPSSVNLSTDLHSLGQYIQDGMRNIMETVINVENPLKDLTIKNMDGDIDGLNYLNGKTVDFVNKKAFAGTLLAHLDGGVPNMVVTIPKIDAYHIGYMIYFFEKACGISGHLAAVNPFNQEGVENYKRNMFALLGKKGFESLKNELEKRL